MLLVLQEAGQAWLPLLRPGHPSGHLPFFVPAPPQALGELQSRCGRIRQVPRGPDILNI